MDEQLQNFPILKNEGKIEGEYKAELDDLSLLFYRIREYLRDQSIRDLPINNLLLGLYGPGDPNTYTRQHLTNVFKDLGLIDDNILQNMHLTQKSFYKNLLEKIQFDNQNNPDTSEFKEYSFLTGMQLSPDEFFDDADQQIVKFIDDIMNKELGYVGYTLLKLGMIRFDGNGQVEFQMPQDLTTIAKIIRVLGINSIAEIGINNIETLLFSMLFSGHYMNLMTIGNDGQIELRKEFTCPGWEFFSDIYSNFTYLTPDPVYHLVMLQTFMNSIHISGRLKLLELNPESEGNVYHLNKPNDGAFGTNKLKQLVYDKDLTFEELDIKLQQYFNMDEELGSNIKMFDILRQQKGWTTGFDYRSGNVAFIKFRLKFNDGSIKSGYVFAHSGIQIMPGITIKDGDYYINPDHWANEIYPAFEVNGKPRDSDAERKIILTLLDQFDMINLVEGELTLYSERPVCPSCDLILSNFELRFSYLENNFQFETHENIRNLLLED
jgi:hypothetical protein